MNDQKFDVRLEKNLGIFSNDEMRKILDVRVLIVGLGGIGGYLANSLCRLGVRYFTIVDYDSFALSNLNRQLFSTSATIGKMKADVVADELLKINPAIHLEKYALPIEKVDAQVFEKADFVFDAVDHIQTKLFLEEMCDRYKRPLIHGALGGWFGQVGISLPESNLLKSFYECGAIGLERSLGAPTFVPPLVAHFMVTQFILFYLGKKEAIVNQIMNIDTLHNDLTIIYKKED